MPEALVESVPAEVLHREISGLGVTHILTVPDTHQKSLLATLSVDPAFSYHVLATEDEALCVNAGLWMGGKEPLVVIQNVGLFAAMNALRGVAMDLKVPTCMMVGQYAPRRHSAGAGEQQQRRTPDRVRAQDARRALLRHRPRRPGWRHPGCLRPEPRRAPPDRRPDQRTHRLRSNEHDETRRCH